MTQEKERALRAVEQYKQVINNMHQLHLDVVNTIDWNVIATQTIPQSIGENEMKAMEKRQAYKPSFFEKLFKQTEKKQTELNRLIDESREKDEKIKQQIIKMKQTAADILSGDVEKYLEVIEENGVFANLIDYGSDYSIRILNPDLVEITYEVNGEDVLPEEELSLTKTGKLSKKTISKTKYNDIFQDYVCSAAIGIARNSFAILPIQEVVVHAYDTVMNSATGKDERFCLLSVRFNKETLNSLNMKRIDCSDSMQNFDHRMNFKATKGFLPVQPLEVQNVRAVRAR